MRRRSLSSLYLLIKESPEKGKRQVEDQDTEHDFDVFNESLLILVIGVVQPMLFFRAGLPFPRNGMLGIVKKKR